MGAYCKQWKLPTSLVNFICLFRIFASCFMVYHRSIFCGLSKFYNLWCKVKFCTIMIWILKSNSKKQNHSPWTELSLKKYLDSAGSNKYKNLIIISTICRTTCKMLYYLLYLVWCLKYGKRASLALPWGYKISFRSSTNPCAFLRQVINIFDK